VCLIHRTWVKDEQAGGLLKKHRQRKRVVRSTQIFLFCRSIALVRVVLCSTFACLEVVCLLVVCRFMAWIQFTGHGHQDANSSSSYRQIRVSGESEMGANYFTAVESGLARPVRLEQQTIAVDKQWQRITRRLITEYR
jgi:hypothetical protein